MSNDLQRALAASLAEETEQEAEERELQEAIMMSLMQNDGGSTTEDTSSGESPKTKRKAEDELSAQSAKRAALAPIEKPSLRSPRKVTLPAIEKPALKSPRAVPSAKPTSSHPTKLEMKYPNGGLRITRTPGRRYAKNCVNLEDVIHEEHLESALAFSFFIGDEELFDHLPFTQSKGGVPIYIGRDVNLDPLVPEVCRRAGISNDKGKLSKAQLQTITPSLRGLYKQNVGKNYNTFYAWSPGSSHSKILALVYPDFLRLVITSCNLMDIDTKGGDNHWYIHDLSKLSSRAKSEPTVFEADFLTHLQALSTPDEFIDSIRGMYDYSKVKVHLITSVPGVCAGAKAEKHGLLRLRRIIQDLDLDLPDVSSGKMRLDICAASIGNLSSKWLNGFNDCAVGKKTLQVANDGSAVPDLHLFFPSVGDVKSAQDTAQLAASNIGCHTRPWNDAPQAIKNIFHHYSSKDTGRLFHQKLILAYNPKDTSTLPYFVYAGSANFSQSAWGALEQDKKKNEATCDTKLVKMTNFECGVVIAGHLIESLLEEGTGSWQDGIVPYDQTAPKYTLPKDRPWNDPRWVTGYQESWQG